MTGEGERKSGLLTGLLVLVVAIFSHSLRAQEISPDEFDALSLKYRTAIHYDPLLQQPIDSLVKLYRDSKRTEELIGLYRSHVEQYPDDAGAKTALIRILRKVDRAGADELIATAVPLHPEYAPLQYLLFRFLSERGDERAAETLSRAIDLESNPARRREWLEELLQIAESDETRELARAQLEKLLLVEGQPVDSLLSLARLMQRFEYHELSLAVFEQIAEKNPAPDEALEAEVLHATAEQKLGLTAEAGIRLDAVLEKLAPDHWRRREIMSQRINIIATAEERAAMLKQAEERYAENPANEALVVDYAELLVASEKKLEAARLLVDRSSALSSSVALETRALEMLEEVGDLGLYKQYLETRLEEQPERTDLRFRLVKIHYANREDASAEQDFKAVVAGLEPGEISEKILELQRYLRRIDRIDAAATYLERYLRNFPARLDVARELAEIFLRQEKPEEVNSLAARVDASGAELENLIDFSEFLISEGFPVGAKQVLGEKIAEEPTQFELGLLMIEAESEIGDRAAAQQQIDRVRELADTATRYAKWLETALRASARFEMVESFFDREQSRYSFQDGAWKPEKVERFMILCEIGKQRLFTDRVAKGIREQLAQTNLDAALRVRLKRFLVSVLDEQSSAADEVITVLEELKSEDPANELEYQLQIGLAHHRGLRLDLSQTILAEMNYSEVESAELLREVIPVLMEYRFYEEAGRALETINRLEPTDVFSWEKRLSILAATGKEKVFRSVIRSLRSGDAGLKLRASSEVRLRDHVLASYYRSMGNMLQSDKEEQLDELLPLLSSIDREEVEPEERLWSLWSRAYILERLNRGPEAASAKLLFEEQKANAGVKSIPFPDGLLLDADASMPILEQIAVRGVREEGGGASFLLQEPELAWAFELDDGGRIVHFSESGEVTLIFDQHQTVYAVDRETGKLLWRESFASRQIRDTGLISLWDEEQLPVLKNENLSPVLQAKDAPSFHANEDSFLLLTESTLRCYESKTGDLRWSAETPFANDDGHRLPRRGSLPGSVFASDSLICVVFRPASREAAGYERKTGKLLWSRRLGELPDDRSHHPVSLNSGVTLGDGMAFLYGYGAEVLDAATGDTVWSFEGAPNAWFPITVREYKGGEDGSVEVASLEGEVVELPEVKAADLEMFKFVVPGRGEISPLTLLEREASMVSSSVQWAGNRLNKDHGALAVMAEGALWLMQNSTVTRVSLSLPLISDELPAEGTFLGVIGSHAWFLKGTHLIHADFVRKQTGRMVFNDLGRKAPLRAVIAGNQIVVRGEAGLKVVNGLTSQVIGQSLWSEQLRDYLSRFPENTPTEVALEDWRGRVIHRGSSALARLSPVEDRISVGGNYYTSFSGRSLICFRQPAAVKAVPAVPPETEPAN